MAGVALVSALAAWLADAPRAAPLRSEEQRGKQLYLQGTSPNDSAIVAVVGRSAIQVPASAVPCVNCHGADGLGRPEGGVIPPDIRWRSLSKPYGHSHPNGRRHPAFTEATVAQAITQGIDPAGNTLDITMPRYALSAEEVQDLLAYLQRLGTEDDPGLTETHIRVGTMLPLQGQRGDIGLAVQGVLRAFFDAVNARGGLYGRQLKLVVAEHTGERVSTLANAARLLADEPVFALLSPITDGVETELAALTEQHELPILSPFPPFAGASLATNTFTFSVFSGLQEQGRVLIEYAVRHLPLKAPRIVVLSPTGAGYTEIAEAIQAQGARHGWTQIIPVTYQPNTFEVSSQGQSLYQSGTQVVVFLGAAQELPVFLESVAHLDWAPYILLPGVLATRELVDVPARFAGRIFLTYPTLPSDRTAQGMQAFTALQTQHKLSPHYVEAQLAAYSAARVLVEGLQRAGKDVSRAKLVRALEGFSAFDTGVTPPLSYGPNRRVGALGAYIVTIDVEHKRLQPIDGWLTP